MGLPLYLAAGCRLYPLWLYASWPYRRGCAVHGLVEALTRAGRLDDARFLFERMLGYANHLGLYGEEISPTGETLGNFPQAFTHLGLISAAFNLDRALGKGI